jgi:hypothetical protein
MVAVDNRLRENEGVDIPAAPRELARELAENADLEWLRELVDILDRRVRTEPLERLIELWGLSNAAAARLFGISRQAFAKWLAKGPPADRADDVASVAMITDTLDRYVKRERIPAVVRRKARVLDDRTVIEAIEAGEYSQTARAVESMLDLRRIQP